MTATAGLSEAILLRLSDRLVAVELQVATNATALKGMADNGVELRRLIAGLGDDVDELRVLASDTRSNFETMRGPLQSLLDLKEKISGAWLALTALLMVLAYLLQPFLAEIIHWRSGSG